MKRTNFAQYIYIYIHNHRSKVLKIFLPCLFSLEKFSLFLMNRHPDVITFPKYSKTSERAFTNKREEKKGKKPIQFIPRLQTLAKKKAKFRLEAPESENSMNEHRFGPPPRSCRGSITGWLIETLNILVGY